MNFETYPVLAMLRELNPVPANVNALVYKIPFAVFEEFEPQIRAEMAKVRKSRGGVGYCRVVYRGPRRNRTWRSMTRRADAVSVSIY